MPHITNRGAGGSLSDKSMITHLHKAAKPHGDPSEIRTRIIGVRGRPPKPLEDGAIKMGPYIFIIESHARPRPWHYPPKGGKRGPEGLGDTAYPLTFH